jgi:signal transduction histidine kinase
MQGFSELLMDEAQKKLSSEGKSFVVRINNSALRLDGLLQDLLSFSRMAQQEMNFAPVSLESVVGSVLLQMKDQIVEKSAAIESIGPWCNVLGHRMTIGQVLKHLLSNALKFVAPGQTPAIRLRTTDAGEFVRVWVEDGGLGISPEHQPQIFKIFTRLNGETYPGTGIGLAIVEKGIERMRGRIGVESTLGNGSRFWFELRKAN